MKKAALLVVLACAVLVAAWASGPFLALHGIRKAIEREDASALPRYVDFPAVRSSVRAQVEDYVARRADGNDSLGGLFATGLASAVGGTAAEMLATPAGIAAVMQGRAVFDRLKPLAAPQPPGATSASPAAPGPLDDASYRFESASRFVVTAHNADGAPVVFVLTRHGLDWNVTDVRLPLQALDPTL